MSGHLTDAGESGDCCSFCHRHALYDDGKDSYCIVHVKSHPDWPRVRDARKAAREEDKDNG